MLERTATHANGTRERGRLPRPVTDNGLVRKPLGLFSNADHPACNGNESCSLQNFGIYELSWSARMQPAFSPDRLENGRENETLKNPESD
jgi:hypothetical protein